MTQLPRWNVIRCAGCKVCFGQHRAQAKCPHCGQSSGEHPDIVTSVTNAQALQLEVAIANTPEELRDELRAKIAINDSLFDTTDEPSMPAILQKIRSNVDENNMISLQSVREVLSKLLPGEEASNFMEMVEAEGLVTRLAGDSWLFFE